MIDADDYFGTYPDGESVESGTRYWDDHTGRHESCIFENGRFRRMTLEEHYARLDARRAGAAKC